MKQQQQHNLNGITVVSIVKNTQMFDGEDEIK